MAPLRFILGDGAYDKGSGPLVLKACLLSPRAEAGIILSIGRDGLLVSLQETLLPLPRSGSKDIATGLYIPGVTSQFKVFSLPFLSGMIIK